jgi:hypothetical protein
MLSESVYGRVWHAARRAALGPDLAAGPLVRRPSDLRHYADGWVMCPAVAFPLLGAAGLVLQSA